MWPCRKDDITEPIFWCFLLLPFTILQMCPGFALLSLLSHNGTNDTYRRIRFACLLAFLLEFSPALNGVYFFFLSLLYQNICGSLRTIFLSFLLSYNIWLSHVFCVLGRWFVFMYLCIDVNPVMFNKRSISYCHFFSILEIFRHAEIKEVCF